MLATAVDDWLVLPMNPAYWLGAVIGGGLIQLLIALAWRKGGSGPTSAAIASVFTVQSLNACGGAPGPLPFVVVINSTALGLLIGLGMHGWAALRKPVAVQKVNDPPS